MSSYIIVPLVRAIMERKVQVSGARPFFFSSDASLFK